MASATATSGGRGVLNSVLFYVFLFLFVLVSMFPLLWVFKMSIITRAELFAAPPTILPQNPTGQEYTQIFSDPAFQQSLLNSAIISGVTTVICLFFGSIAAYAIARLRFRFKSPVMTLILAISFFPAVAIIAPLFLQFSAVGLIEDRKSTRLNSSHANISYAVFCLKKKKNNIDLTSHTTNN